MLSDASGVYLFANVYMGKYAICERVYTRIVITWLMVTFDYISFIVFQMNLLFLSYPIDCVYKYMFTVPRPSPVNLIGAPIVRSPLGIHEPAPEKWNGREKVILVSFSVHLRLQPFRTECTMHASKRGSDRLP